MNLDLYDDPEFQILIRKYLKYLQKELVGIKEHIQQKNFLEIRKFSHNLKGTGGGYGFDEFTNLGGKINLAAHEEDIPLIESYISEFELELNKAFDQYKSTD
ncbi:MAG: hypothetical protein IIB95_05035 [Candidatus Marinimicrobia bacterium]|nr:hypothetical protein [Candidatus Neomarinimicrobiota bacterium]MCH7763091.1 hypothetical protein [Candidatus Neomarinimicrobiota bacterium]